MSEQVEALEILWPEIEACTGRINHQIQHVDKKKGENYVRNESKVKCMYKYYSQRQTNWKTKLYARLEVFMGALLYV